MNPIEALIKKWDESWDYESVCAHELTEAIKPYLIKPGPPTEPGSYLVKWNYIDEPRPVFFDGTRRLFNWRDIEWHSKVMPPFGEVPVE